MQSIGDSASGDQLAREESTKQFLAMRSIALLI